MHSSGSSSSFGSLSNANLTSPEAAYLGGREIYGRSPSLEEHGFHPDGITFCEALHARPPHTRWQRQLPTLTFPQPTLPKLSSISVHATRDGLRQAPSTMKPSSATVETMAPSTAKAKSTSGRASMAKSDQKSRNSRKSSSAQTSSHVKVFTVPTSRFKWLWRGQPK